MKLTSVLPCTVLFFLLLAPSFSTSSAGQEQSNTLLFIDAQTGEPYQTFRQEIYTALADLGYVEGKNLKTTYYTLGNFVGRAKNIWDIVEKQKKYNAILLSGTITGIAFKEIAEESPDTEFIFGCITDPVGIGLIDNFTDLPTGKFTGVAYPVKMRSRFRFLKKLMPSAKKIGYVSTDMPQSQSYERWMKETLAEKEFQDLEIIYRTVPFVKSDAGHVRMTLLARRFIVELEPKVDVFLAPHDQMGISEEFGRMVYKNATKPLLGISIKNVMQGHGATMAISPSLKKQAFEVAGMIKQVFEGRSVKSIMPLWLNSYEIAFDLTKTKQFGIAIPPNLLEEAGENVAR